MRVIRTAKQPEDVNSLLEYLSAYQSDYKGDQAQRMYDMLRERFREINPLTATDAELEMRDAISKRIRDLETHQGVTSPEYIGDKNFTRRTGE
jgi:hypothetical protein